MKQGQILTYIHTQRATIHVSIMKTVAANFQWLKAKRLAKMYRKMQTRITLCNQVKNMVGKQSFYKMKGIIHLLA